MEKILNEKGTWLFIAPITNLIITEDSKNEIKVDKITFIKRTKLLRNKKRIGFPVKTSDLKSKFSTLQKYFFDKYGTFAILRLTGKGNELQSKFLAAVRDELAILALSQLSYSRRRYNAMLSIASENVTGELSYFMINNNTGHWIQSNSNSKKVNRLVINKIWLQRQKKDFFSDLLKIIRGEINVKNNWRLDIKNASILVGQSLLSTNLQFCFLWNMIAIELLLTASGEKIIDTLPSRVEAFLEWLVYWKEANYKERIRSIYQKRNSFVHNGDREKILISDLLFSDVLVLNVLLNIVKHPKIFNSKEDLIIFSKKIEAEHLLGLKPKIRPKTFRALLPSFNNEDYHII